MELGKSNPEASKLLTSQITVLREMVNKKKDEENLDEAGMVVPALSRMISSTIKQKMDKLMEELKADSNLDSNAKAARLQREISGLSQQIS